MNNVYFCALVNLWNGKAYFAVTRYPHNLKHRLLNSPTTGYGGAEQLKLELTTHPPEAFRFDVLAEAPESQEQDFCAKAGSYIVNNWNYQDLYNRIKLPPTPDTNTHCFLNGRKGQRNLNPIPVWYETSVRPDHPDQLDDRSTWQKVHMPEYYFDPEAKFDTKPVRTWRKLVEIEHIITDVATGKAPHIVSMYVNRSESKVLVEQLQAGNPAPFCDWLRLRLGPTQYREDPNWDGDASKSKLVGITTWPKGRRFTLHKHSHEQLYKRTKAQKKREAKEKIQAFRKLNYDVWATALMLAKVKNKHPVDFLSQREQDQFRAEIENYNKALE